MHIAIALIDQDNEYLLQQRGMGDNIGSPGKIGCFGGKVDEGETPEEAIAREIAEETTLTPQPRDFVAIGTLLIKDSLRGVEYDITVDAYRLIVPSNSDLGAKEGMLIRIAHDEVKRSLDMMTPATKELFLDYIL